MPSKQRNVCKRSNSSMLLLLLFFFSYENESSDTGVNGLKKWFEKQNVSIIMGMWLQKAKFCSCSLI